MSWGAIFGVVAGVELTEAVIQRRNSQNYYNNPNQALWNGAYQQAPGVYMNQAQIGQYNYPGQNPYYPGYNPAIPYTQFGQPAPTAYLNNVNLGYSQMGWARMNQQQQQAQQHLPPLQLETLGDKDQAAREATDAQNLATAIGQYERSEHDPTLQTELMTRFAECQRDINTDKMADLSLNQHGFKGYYVEDFIKRTNAMLKNEPGAKDIKLVLRGNALLAEKSHGWFGHPTYYGGEVMIQNPTYATFRPWVPPTPGAPAPAAAYRPVPQPGTNADGTPINTPPNPPNSGNFTVG